jgi:hypothetical protein
MSTPNWFAAMVQFSWTIKTISRSFDVPREIAQQIQRDFPSYPNVCAIASAHRALCSQIGH